MTTSDESKPGESAPDPDPERFVTDGGPGLWFEVVIRNQDGTFEVPLAELSGSTVDGEAPSDDEFARLVAEVLRAAATGLTGG